AEVYRGGASAPTHRAHVGLGPERMRTRYRRGGWCHRRLRSRKHPSQSASPCRACPRLSSSGQSGLQCRSPCVLSNMRPANRLVGECATFCVACRQYEKRSALNYSATVSEAHRAIQVGGEHLERALTV